MPASLRNPRRRWTTPAVAKSLRPWPEPKSTISGWTLVRSFAEGLDAFARHPGWLITELNFHFRGTDERDSVMLEEKLPALACVLPITIDAVDWWPVGLPQTAPPAAESPGQGSLKSFFTRWFGAG
jgi:hypothetical protein